ncbi:aerobic glycerol-3-phosphate dehydrogenase [Fulvimarina pelagi HTCC2506]|uniref:Glycerol-3-phosphate dehydrogenase n=1 Tax=Fulvimarina pelagi HTCC2506 TaxID=314231 RepID=Q0G6K2_9HYPH|nr:glycerol-3-phosphate dehydrogenase [Fulvimarina pelagi]EAU42712.1 aerobic glycerol-3-phosphate dehydrogenase [Fulvimarina pelagi HTCC2506]
MPSPSQTKIAAPASGSVVEQTPQPTEHVVDLFIIGGGVNGCGIARDAAGRGYSVTLAEMNDLASATSSKSTKLFHGGLRYLEYFEFSLVREALHEREVLLKAMPHIAWPMRFVLPYNSKMRFETDTPASKLLSTIMPWTKGRRPAWMIRLGLFIYDAMGGRTILPGAKSVDLDRDPAGVPLKDEFKTAFEYSDCWVEDSRLVALNARDASARGARIMTRCKVNRADREDGHWVVETENTENGERRTFHARMLVNAGGPWAADVIARSSRANDEHSVRLVRGSHLVVPKLFDHDKAYFLQGEDGRIIFVIPYETDFTLIGTTDQEHADPEEKPETSTKERDYLLSFVNRYFEKSLEAEDVVWDYSGVRPLFDDGASSATAATRDYVLKLDRNGAPLLNIFGGKITTYRRLSEGALSHIDEALGRKTRSWTAGAALPGGDFGVDETEALVKRLKADHPFLTDRWARRLTKAYGTEASALLGAAKTVSDLGRDFGANLTEAEVKWLMDREFARTAEDVVWRRSKLGLRLDAKEIAALDRFMASRGDSLANAAE